MTEIQELEERVSELEALLQTRNRQFIDSRYQIVALVQMLGPKATQVWQMWRDQGVQRMHTSWGPEAAKMSGEEIAQAHLDFAAAPKTLIENIDSHLNQVHFKTDLKELVNDNR